MTTHLLEEAEYLSDRLAIITSGKLRFIGTCSEMRATYNNCILLTISKLHLTQLLILTNLGISNSFSKIISSIRLYIVKLNTHNLVFLISKSLIIRKKRF
jgi:ABC-type multidrug transport system ATPase subunit